MNYKLLFILLLSLIPIQADEILYLSSGGSISVKQINQETGELKLIQKVELPGSFTFTFSPNAKFLYVQNSTRENKKRKNQIAIFSINSQGLLKQLSNVEASTVGTEIRVDKSGQFLAASRSGKAFIWKLEGGSIEPDFEFTARLEKGTHAVRFSPDNKFLYVPATASNKIFCLSFNQKNGECILESTSDGPEKGACQPRHLSFHPTLDYVYSTQERSKPGIAAWKRNPDTGELKLIQNITTSDDTSSTITTADIHIHPNGKYVFISSRDKSGLNNEIIAFKINQKNGLLELTSRTKCEHIPRSFCISKSGRFLFIAGQGDNKLGVYKISDEGMLPKITQYEAGQKPIWVETVKIK